MLATYLKAEIVKKYILFKYYIFLYLSLALNSYCGIFNNIYEFKNQNFLTDLVLISNEGEEFPCHKLLLAAFSPYFEKMFKNNMQEGLKNKIYLNHSSFAIKIILDFVYDPHKINIDIALKQEVYLELLDFSNYAFIKNMKFALVNTKIRDIKIDDILLKYAIFFEDENIIKQLFINKINIIKPQEHIINSNNYTRSVSFSPDGKKFLFSEGSIAKVFGSFDGPKLFNITNSRGASFLSNSFSHDGSLIITASSDHIVNVWNAQNGELVFSIEDEQFMNSAYLSPDGASIMTISPKFIKVWDFFTRDLKYALRPRSYAIHSASFSPDGKRIAVACFDKKTRIINESNGILELVLDGHLGEVTSANFSFDNKNIITTSKDGAVRIWNADDGSVKMTKLGRYFNHALFSPDGTKVLTSSHALASIWDTKTGEHIIDLIGLHSWFSSIAFSHDGTLIATASDDNTVRIWRIPPYEMLNDKELFKSKNALLWIKLKYYLAEYIARFNKYKILSYKEFKSDITDEYVINFINNLEQGNNFWINYCKGLFSDFNYQNLKDPILQ